MWIKLLAAVVLFVAWYAFVGAPAQDERVRQVAELQQRLNAEKAAFAPVIADFEAELSEKWPVQHTTVPGWRERRYFMMSHDQERLGVLHVRWRDGLTSEWEPEIEITSVASVELQQNESTIMRLETVGTTKKSGSLGRAAVGGILLGGVGALVGAASAGSKTVAKTTSTSTTVKGPLFLVIGTTHMDRPVIKERMNSRQEGEEWLHRIRGALILAERS